MHACTVLPGQPAPPFWAGTLTINDMVCVPPPHEAEHGPAENEPWQSTGQPCTLHGWLWGEAGHEAPPYAGCWVTVNAWLCVPPPHEAVQPLQPDHVPWQLTGGQACWLQACVCGDAGQAAPPCCGATATLNTWDCEPPPHGAEHEPKPDHDPWQSTGHGCGLHAWIWLGLPGQAWPPFCACETTVNVDDCVPPPQVAEHGPKADHEPTQSSGGHGCVLHGCVLGEAGQAAPPKAGCVVTVNTFCCEPPPQAAVHWPQAPQVP